MRTPKPTRIHYRLADDANNDHALWTGGVTVWRKVTKAEARAEVAKTLRVKRLPARTLVLTDHDLESGEWTEDEIRAETTKLAPAPSDKRKVDVSVHDVPLSMDDVQDMLKKFGLA